MYKLIYNIFSFSHLMVPNKMGIFQAKIIDVTENYICLLQIWQTAPRFTVVPLTHRVQMAGGFLFHPFPLWDGAPPGVLIHSRISPRGSPQQPLPDEKEAENLWAGLAKHPFQPTNCNPLNKDVWWRCLYVCWKYCAVIIMVSIHCASWAVERECGCDSAVVMSFW